MLIIPALNGENKFRGFRSGTNYRSIAVAYIFGTFHNSFGMCCFLSLSLDSKPIINVVVYQDLNCVADQKIASNKKPEPCLGLVLISYDWC